MACMQYLNMCSVVSVPEVQRVQVGERGVFFGTLVLHIY